MDKDDTKKIRLSANEIARRQWRPWQMKILDAIGRLAMFVDRLFGWDKR